MHPLQHRLQQVLRVLHQNLIGRLAPWCHSLHAAYVDVNKNRQYISSLSWTQQEYWGIERSPGDDAELVGDGEDLLNNQGQLCCTLLVQAVVGDDSDELCDGLAVGYDLLCRTHEVLFVLEENQSKMLLLHR